MANRIMLNQTSYHGAGAIQEIVNEAKAHGFKKAFVCSDPDLVKFNVTSKVTDLLKENGLDYELYSDIKPNPTIFTFQYVSINTMPRDSSNEKYPSLHSNMFLLILVRFTTSRSAISFTFQYVSINTSFWYRISFFIQLYIPICFY